MAVGLPLKTTYANGDVYSAQDVNDITGTINANINPFAPLKNRLINGAMEIDQRRNGASFTPTTDLNYTVDRWQARLSQSSKYSIQRNAGAVTPPPGYNNYVGLTSLSAYSVTSTDFFGINQSIEGYNMADFAWGTSSAKTVTLSFWVRSSLTGTFGGSLFNNGASRAYAFSYTISAANTWEQKSVTIAGDGVAGGLAAWVTDNQASLIVNFSIGAGSSVSGTAGSWGGTLLRSATGAVSVVGTNGATWYVTGTQLEIGSTATPFVRCGGNFQGELAACQRYFQALTGSGEGIFNCNYYTPNGPYGVLPLKQTMRIAPTLTVNSASSFTVLAGGVQRNTTAISISASTVDQVEITMTTASGTSAQGAWVRFNGAGSYMQFSSEL